jgi:hypothetical protein
MQTLSTARSESQILATNKVLKNTYALLSATLFFSVLMAVLSMAVEPPRSTGLFSMLAAMGLIWFALPRTANSSKGLWVVFGITGLLGFGIGPMLNSYMEMAGGSQIVATAFSGTGLIFLGLSGYALTSKKDFSFMAGFLMVGHGWNGNCHRCNDRQYILSNSGTVTCYLSSRNLHHEWIHPLRYKCNYTWRANELHTCHHWHVLEHLQHIYSPT